MSISLVQIQSIITTTEAIGATVPTEITDAITRAEKVRKAAYEIGSERGELAKLTLAAISQDRDPASDPAIQRVLTAERLGEGIPQLVTSLADADVVIAVQANVDTLIESWQEPFNRAASDLATAARSLGGIDLANAAEVLHKGGDAAEQWTIATRANRTITEIVDAWTLLAHQTGFASVARHYLVMKLTTPTLEQWETLELRERKLSAWEAHQMGLNLSLATRQTYSTRINSLAQAREARDRAGLHRELGKDPSASMSLR